MFVLVVSEIARFKEFVPQNNKQACFVTNACMFTRGGKSYFAASLIITGSVFHIFGSTACKI